MEEPGLDSKPGAPPLGPAQREEAKREMRWGLFLVNLPWIAVLLVLWWLFSR